MSTLYPTNVASSTPFDNAGVEFISDNAQDAIVEAKEAGDLALALPRFPLSSIHNGSLSNGQLIGISNLVNTPIVVPIKSVIKEVTMYQDGGANRDGQFRFYRNTETAPNLFFTWTLNNTTSAVANGDGVDFTSPTFVQGDLLRVYFDDIGQNMQDLTMTYLFQAIE